MYLYSIKTTKVLMKYFVLCDKVYIEKQRKEDLIYE